MKISAKFHSHVRVLLKSQRAFHRIKRTSYVLPQHNVLVEGIYLRRTILRNTFRNSKSRQARSGVLASGRLTGAFGLSGVRAFGCSIFEARSVSEARSCDAGSWHLVVAKKAGFSRYKIIIIMCPLDIHSRYLGALPIALPAANRPRHGEVVST